MNMFHVYSFHYITPKLLKEGADKFCIKEFRTTYIGDGADTRIITFPSEPLFFIAFCMSSSTIFTQYSAFYIKGMPRIFSDFRNHVDVEYTISGNIITMKSSIVNLNNYTYYLFAICA